MTSLLTVAEVAAILKLNPQTICNWMDAGRFPYVRLGERRVRIYQSDFQALLRAAQLASAPPCSIWDGMI